LKFSQTVSAIFQNEWVVLTLLLLLALALRLTNIGATSFWIDELYTFMVANGRLQPESLPQAVHSAMAWASHYIAWQPLTWQALMDALKINVHMPLYYLLLNPWLHWFGTNEFGLRSFSAVVSTLMLIPLYLLGKSLTGSRRVGYWVVLIGALSPFQIYYGQEGRMYALAMFWTAWACLALWKTLYARKPLGWSVLYALSLLGGFFTHYMFAFIVAFHGLYLLLWLVREPRNEPRERKRIALVAVPFLVLGLALWRWMPIYHIQHAGLNEEYHFAKSMVKWHRYISLPLWQPLVMVAGSSNLERVVYFPLLIGLMVFHLYQVKRGAIRLWEMKGELFLSTWIFVPLLLQIAYDCLNQTHISVMDRYVLLIAPGVATWAGLTLYRVFTPNPEMDDAKSGVQPNPSVFHRPAWGVGVAAVLLVMACLCVMAPSPFRDEHNKTKDMRKNIRYIAAHAQPQDLVLVNGPWGSNLIAAYYLNQSRPNQPILYWMSPYRGREYPLPSKTLLTAYHRVWLLTYRSTNERGLSRLKEHLATLYPHHTEKTVWTLYSP
jgi:uncharacterized membrane protein